MWVDISGGLLHRTHIPSGETVTAALGEVSAAFPVRGGGLVYTGGHRVIHREPAGGTHDQCTERVVATAPADPVLRFNDGAVDPAGRVWVGSMHIPETSPRGVLYRLDHDRRTGSGVLTPVQHGATVSNGIGWSPDGTRMYYSDSPTRRLDVFDYDQATGRVSGRRAFAGLSAFDGVPDGLTVDLDGCVWVAMWDGGVLLRLAPSGELDAVVPMPVARPTSLAFGGPGMASLYVTTARLGLPAASLAAQPLAGRLLRLVPGPVGLPATTTPAALPS